MSLVELSAVIGSLLPMAVAVVNQPRWPAWGRAAATAVLCVVAGGVSAAAAGELTGKSWLQAAGVVFAAALLTYHAWWKPSGITSTIEQKTAIR